MASLNSIARPYAQAAFEYAREKKQLPEWQRFLNYVSRITKDASVYPLLTSPQLTADDWRNFYFDMLSTQLADAEKNFLTLLAQNNRLLALPEITELFNEHYADYEKISHIKIVSAIHIDDAYKQKLADVLTKRIRRQVVLHCETDSSLVGGATIHIGDRVIDGSVRGKLNRLLEHFLR
jgi:F-type H+-transporting ATPase subunit delta